MSWDSLPEASGFGRQDLHFQEGIEPEVTPIPAPAGCHANDRRHDKGHSVTSNLGCLILKVMYQADRVLALFRFGRGSEEFRTESFPSMCRLDFAFKRTRSRMRSRHDAGLDWLDCHGVYLKKQGSLFVHLVSRIRASGERTSRTDCL